MPDVVLNCRRIRGLGQKALNSDAAQKRKITTQWILMQSTATVTPVRLPTRKDEDA